MLVQNNVKEIGPGFLCTACRAKTGDSSAALSCRFISCVLVGKGPVSFYVFLCTLAI